MLSYVIGLVFISYKFIKPPIFADRWGLKWLEMIKIMGVSTSRHWTIYFFKINHLGFISDNCCTFNYQWTKLIQYQVPLTLFAISYQLSLEVYLAMEPIWFCLNLAILWDQEEYLWFPGILHLFWMLQSVEKSKFT